MAYARTNRLDGPSFILSSAFIAALLGAGACGGQTRQTGESPANPLDPTELSLVSALNSHRTQAGAAEVTVCRSLNVAASAHSDDMRNNEYQSGTGKDGSTVKIRACDAGYAPACEGHTMAELIASGSAEPEHTLGQWKEDPSSGPILVDADLKVVGVGLALGGEKPIWTLDFGILEDASCE